MTTHKLAFIGGGNMARSLISGLIRNGHDAEQIRVSDPSTEVQNSLQQAFGIRTGNNNTALIEWADTVILAVKPQVMAEVCVELSEAVKQHKPLILSIAAGIRESALARWLGSDTDADTAIVRTMPNTPALVGAGITALHGNSHVSTTQHDQAESIMRAAGLTLWLEDESQMDAVTAVSGSGPAYFFLFIESLEKAAIESGLPAEQARLLALQTAFGAAKMALESDSSSAELRRRVTSPGGTTERALAVFKQQGLPNTVQLAVDAARSRSIELAQQLCDDDT